MNAERLKLLVQEAAQARAYRHEASLQSHANGEYGEARRILAKGYQDQMVDLSERIKKELRG